MSLAAFSEHDGRKLTSSGWIGQVPAHWNVEKLGSMLKAVS